MARNEGRDDAVGRDIVPIADMEVPSPGSPPRAGGPVAGVGVGGLLRRLFGGRKKSAGPKMKVRVARLAGDDDGTLSRYLAGALAGRDGMEVEAAESVFEMPKDDDLVSALAGATCGARRMLSAEGADLLIWGTARPHLGTIDLRLTPAAADGEERSGCIGGFAHLVLPARFDQSFALFLHAFALAAATQGADSRSLAVRRLVEPALEAAQATGRDVPPELTPQERALLQGAYGQLVALVGWQKGAADWLVHAEDALRAALKGLSHVTAPLEWALIQKTLGALLLGRAERGDAQDVGETIDRAINALREALRVLDQATFPEEWAATQARLARALCRLEQEDGDPDLLKGAVAAYQSALHVYTRVDHPWRWAEMMNGLSQVLQVLGGHLRNPDVVEKAVVASRAALEVRNARDTPLAWAATQNNLGGALFLLARTAGEVEHLEEAREAFSRALGIYSSSGAERLAMVTRRNLDRVEKAIESLGRRKSARVRWQPRNPIEVREDTPEEAGIEDDAEID